MTLVSLILIHLGLNYLYPAIVDGGNTRCVRSLTLPTLNRQRASLILTHLFDSTFRAKSLMNIPTPRIISQQEHLFTHQNILSSEHHTANFTNVHSIYALLPPTITTSKIESIFVDEEYKLWFQRLPHNKISIAISLETHLPIIHFKAWTHAYVLAGLLANEKLVQGMSDEECADAAIVSHALKRVNEGFERAPGIERGLIDKGWNLEASMMCPVDNNLDRKTHPE